MAGLPGYEKVDLEARIADLLGSDPAISQLESKKKILSFLRSRDAVAVLAKTGEQCLSESTRGNPGPGLSGLEQAHVELLQAFMLAAGTGKTVPASPRSMLRLWELLDRNLNSYMIGASRNNEPTHEDILIHRVRTRTVAYRNSFSGRDAADVVPALLTPLDSISHKELGYSLADFVRTLFDICQTIWERLKERNQRSMNLLEGGDAEDAVQEIAHATELTSRIWHRCDARCTSPTEERAAAFQAAEMLCPSIFDFERSALEERFGTALTAALFSCALPFGAITEADLSRIYLNNPIWKRPFVLLRADTLLLPIPGLIVSFTLMIVEGLMVGKEKLLEAYSNARSTFLEDDVERLIREALPSAAVYRGVKWWDADENKQAEHDVVAVIGMHVLIFEAKSGKLSDAARRGAAKSLRTDFQKLFIDPGKQAARLEKLLGRTSRDFLLLDHDGKTVHIDRHGPCVVHKFGICLEQFAGVTSNRRLFEEINLLKDTEKWAPILTLGELRMISRRLDTELAFLHYLTRRTTIDDMFDAFADEQDLLSMYLTNGFAIDAREMANQKVMFFQADAAVRGHFEPRLNRREFSTAGVHLSPMWRLIAQEIYAGKDRHRFDMLMTVLNQDPHALISIEKKIKRWRLGAGKGGGDLITSRARIGTRVFVIAVYMAKRLPPDATGWTVQSREIDRIQVGMHGATDCVVLLMTRKSKESTFDAIAFFRNATQLQLNA